MNESADLHGAGPLRAMTAGLGRALALTAVHESARRILPRAPRMDVLGARALGRVMRAAGLRPPRGRALHRAALLGDVVSNTLYYALVAAGRTRSRPLRGAALGALAGLGAVVLPPYLGLGAAPRGRTRATQGLTIGWYLLGGLVAGSLMHWFERRSRS